MRLNWFSPLPPQRTDIAHYTARIAAALMRRFDVVFWTDLAADTANLPPGAVARHFEPSQIDGHDFNKSLFGGLNIYNLGNDARFHSGISQISRKIPGIVILHDTHLHHLTFEQSRRDNDNFSHYINLAGSLYGAMGEATARLIVQSDGALIDAHVANMPFVEAFAGNALGAICHSGAASAGVRRQLSIPVLTLPLAFASLAPKPDVERVWRAPWRFVMFGYLSTNRRLESVLRALSRWREHADFHLDIFGSLWDRPLIEALIADCGLENHVRLRGFVPESVLDTAIAGAHLAFNLRHPTVGEASGGILRSWALATPSLVTDAGWYAQLPSNAVRKVPLDNEIDDIVRALDELVAAPFQFEKMGLLGLERLDAGHSPEAYTHTLGAALEALPLLEQRFLHRRLLTGFGPGPGPDALAARAQMHLTQLLSPSARRD